MKEKDLCLLVWEAPKFSITEDVDFINGATMIPVSVNKISDGFINLTPFILRDGFWWYFSLGKDKNGEDLNCLQILDDDKESTRLIPYDWFSANNYPLKTEYYRNEKD